VWTRRLAKKSWGQALVLMNRRERESRAEFWVENNIIFLYLLFEVFC